MGMKVPASFLRLFTTNPRCSLQGVDSEGLRKRFQNCIWLCIHAATAAVDCTISCFFGQYSLSGGVGVHSDLLFDV
jgi:hypothetical protein